MAKSTDERGRIYLPKDIREHYGTDYRVVELPSYVALLPIAEDPLAAVQEAVGGVLEGRSPGELQTEARQKTAREIATEREDTDVASEGQ